MFAALTGAGLSAAAGLNAFIPLVIVGIFARFTDVVELPDQLMWLQSWPVLILGLVLLAAEVVLDKIPGVDTVNDLIQTAVRPLVGGVIFAASASAAEFDDHRFWTDHPLIAGIVGAVIAAVVHISKTASRPAVNASTGGTGAPLASFAEDAIAVGLSFLAIFIPVLVVIVFVVLGVMFYRIVTSGRRRRKHKSLLQTQSRLAREAAQADGRGSRRERWRAWTSEYRERLGSRGGGSADSAPSAESPDAPAEATPRGQSPA
ncbi:DUF4126 domain-containing protein [Demequina capsici]|uniref:DUF4126 domain-containing protein n=1 Tax=Demequina capsici TaxID=3075620 RepID=A0AA96J8B0_9MICO|nr:MULTISPECIES: DUF4126 domain-containing protein [unclassified Demequina]WNM25260.1 DUF4126 domain-containing protein [Demequina sp. OYTSA14]WNM28157.1 DUF4126 domain-containing protein [Demequina sp. PMTSA13]